MVACGVVNCSCICSHVVAENHASSRLPWVGLSHGFNMARGSRVTTGRIHTQHLVPRDSFRRIQEISFRSQVPVHVKLEPGNDLY